MRIGVIGSGVAGLSATWALNEHSPHEVHLFESSQEYIGGHTHTVEFQDPTGEKKESTWVDTGFIVFNEVTYPNFLRFLKYVSVPILSSDMSFSVSRSLRSSSSPNSVQRGAFEWAGATPFSLFCQPTNLVNPSHWRMVWDIIRFNYQSLDTLREAARGQKGKGGAGDERESIGDWLDKRGYGESFRKNYLIPMTASIWSTPPSTAFSAFPALTLLRFMHNHHLLQILDRPQWLTIKGGSKTYVDRILERLPPSQLHQGAKGEGNVVKVTRDDAKGIWTLHTKDGRSHDFDRLVFASHADTTRNLLLKELGKDQEGIKIDQTLGAFAFSKNSAVLHADEKLMPVRKGAWSAWNFLAESSGSDASSSTSLVKTGLKRDTDRVTLTYWMNLLQSLPVERYGPILVTLNPPPKGQGYPDEDLVLAEYAYEHPIYTSRSVAAQKELGEHQGWKGVHFAGAWLNYGFHEDGFSAGMRAAVRLGAETPFAPRPAERPIPSKSLLATLLLTLVEAFRANIAGPFTALLVAPLVIVLAALVSALAPAAVLLSQPTRRDLAVSAKRIREDWQDHRASRGQVAKEKLW